MPRLTLVHALVQLHRLEKEAKQGELSREDVTAALGFQDPRKTDCVQGTGMALLHLPVKTSMDLAWFAVTPVLTAFVVFYGLLFEAFALFVVGRMAIWAYDSALLRHGRRTESIPYNSSTMSTLLGTFPYRGNWVLGPGATVALDILVVLPFSGVLALGNLGLLGHAVEAGAVAHALLTLVTRVGLNTAVAVEMAGGVDRWIVHGAEWVVRSVQGALTDVARVIARAPPVHRADPERAASTAPPLPWRDKAYHLRMTDPQALNAG